MESVDKTSDPLRVDPLRVDPLLAEAMTARDRAYAPYSGFRVGAAVETDDGSLIAGCNVESASFGLTVCAERVAVFAAVARGYRSVRRLAVVTDTPTPTPPCGACRQVLFEFAADAEVLMANTAGLVISSTVRELLPRAFDASQLGVARPVTPPPERSRQPQRSAGNPHEPTDREQSRPAEGTR